MASRLVSIFRLSMLRLSTPVARIAKASAVQNRNVPQGHVAAVLEADGFVADPGGQHEVVISTAEALAPDQPLAFDGNIFQFFPQIRLLCQWL